MKSPFNELILVAGKDGGKKKGKSLEAIFKLIQSLLEFEDKIVECSEAQEMGENKERIEALKAETGEMYNSLFEMAQGGVDSYRNKIESMEPVEDDTDSEDKNVEDLREREEIGDAVLELPKQSKVNSVTAPTSLRLPSVPKM